MCVVLLLCATLHVQEACRRSGLLLSRGAFKVGHSLYSRVVGSRSIFRRSAGCWKKPAVSVEPSRDRCVKTDTHSWERAPASLPSGNRSKQFVTLACGKLESVSYTHLRAHETDS